MRKLLRFFIPCLLAMLIGNGLPISILMITSNGPTLLAETPWGNVLAFNSVMLSFVMLLSWRLSKK